MREFLFVIFILSGTLKMSVPYLEYLPDITIVSALCIMFYLFYDILVSNLWIRKNDLFLIIILVIYYIIIILSLGYTSSPFFGYFKTIAFIINIIAFTFPFVCKQFCVAKFMKSFIALSLACTVAFALFYPLVKANILPGFNEIETDKYRGMYLPVSTTTGLAFFLLVIYCPVSFKKYRTVIGLWFLFIMLIAGARAPLFFTIILFLIWAIGSGGILKFLKYRIKKNYVLISISLIPILLFAVLGFINHPNVKDLIKKRIARYELLFSEDKGASINERVDHIHFVFHSMQNNSEKTVLLGHGFGSYGVIKEGVDGKLHPHNFFLESLFELGLLGTVPLVIFLCFSFILMFYNNWNLGLLVPMLYIFANSNKSSSISELRIFFAFLAIGILINRFNITSREREVGMINYHS